MAETLKSDKIGGFDKWEVNSAVDDLIRVEEIKNKPKFYAVVKQEFAKKMRAMAETAFEHKIKVNMKKTFGEKE